MKCVVLLLYYLMLAKFVLIFKAYVYSYISSLAKMVDSFIKQFSLYIMYESALNLIGVFPEGSVFCVFCLLLKQG